MDHHPALPLPPFQHNLLDSASTGAAISPASCGGNTNSCKSSSFLCRQTSTRWIPTPDQIRILKDLYYNGGVRSPSAEEIQRISARLRQYGKIEGKNVFYWFQNHKARERQKRRLTVDVAAAVAAGGCPATKLMTNFTPGMISPTSPAGAAGLYAVGHLGASGCGGSMLMERASTLREMEGSVGWVGLGALPQYYYHPQQQRAQQVYYTDMDNPCYYAGTGLSSSVHKNVDEEAAAGGLETLPLFPTNCCKPEYSEDLFTHNHDASSSIRCGDLGAAAWGSYNNYQDQLSGLYEGAAAASLELTLNSYGASPGCT